VKKVEFGAKVNMIKVDGLSFIEYLSFDASNANRKWWGNKIVTNFKCKGRAVKHKDYK
jgi:hypothetical protein